ncbi:hypothetical protein LINPERPRIM_LOCUS1650 [Linum perenne]
MLSTRKDSPNPRRNSMHSSPMSHSPPSLS